MITGNEEAPWEEKGALYPINMHWGCLYPPPSAWSQAGETGVRGSLQLEDARRDFSCVLGREGLPQEGREGKMGPHLTDEIKIK